MKLARSWLWVVWMAATLPMAASPARACTCNAPATAAEAWGKASAVFAGRVTGVSRSLLDRLRITRTGNHRVAFEITKRWKGAGSKRVVVVTRLSAEACGFPFVEGQEYLVYVAKGWGGIETGICTGTKGMAGAEAETEALDRLHEETRRRPDKRTGSLRLPRRVAASHR